MVMVNMERSSCQNLSSTSRCFRGLGEEVLEDEGVRVFGEESSEKVEKNMKDMALVLASPTTSCSSSSPCSGVSSSRVFECSGREEDDRVAPTSEVIDPSDEETKKENNSLVLCPREATSTTQWEKVVADTILWEKPLFEKTLNPSDVGDFHRLSIHKKMAMTHMPPLKSDDDKYKPMITFLDYKNKPWIMNYERWSSGNMVLRSGWNDFVTINNICCGDTIQIYAHVDHQLHVHGVDDTKYVYGIHFSKPSNPRSISRWWGSYWVVDENKNNVVGEVIPSGFDSKFKANGGRKRKRKLCWL